MKLLVKNCVLVMLLCVSLSGITYAATGKSLNLMVDVTNSTWVAGSSVFQIPELVRTHNCAPTAIWGPKEEILPGFHHYQCNITGQDAAIGFGGVVKTTQQVYCEGIYQEDKEPTITKSSAKNLTCQFEKYDPKSNTATLKLGYK